MKKVYLVQGYHHCSIGDALKKYLKGLGTYSVEAIDMFAIEPEMIDFREADIVVLTMGVEPEKGKHHPEEFYEVNDKLAYHVASIAKACGVKQFLVLSTTDVYGRNLGKVTAKSKLNVDWLCFNIIFLVKTIDCFKQESGSISTFSLKIRNPVKTTDG